MSACDPLDRPHGIFSTSPGASCLVRGLREHSNDWVALPKSSLCRAWSVQRRGEAKRSHEVHAFIVCSWTVNPEPRAANVKATALAIVATCLDEHRLVRARVMIRTAYR